MKELAYQDEYWCFRFGNQPTFITSNQEEKKQKNNIDLLLPQWKVHQKKQISEILSYAKKLQSGHLTTLFLNLNLNMRQYDSATAKTKVSVIIVFYCTHYSKIIRFVCGLLSWLCSMKYSEKHFIKLKFQVTWCKSFQCHSKITYKYCTD